MIAAETSILVLFHGLYPQAQLSALTLAAHYSAAQLLPRRGQTRLLLYKVHIWPFWSILVNELAK